MITFFESVQALARWREDNPQMWVTATNGCFDILHAGHVRLLELAAQPYGFVLVGINGDESVRRLKGEGRPVNRESDRAAVIGGLRSVNGVVVFQETRATQFLKAARPNLYVKGGDYSLATLDKTEVAALNGAPIQFIPLVKGRDGGKISSTDMVQQMRHA